MHECMHACTRTITNMVGGADDDEASTLSLETADTTKKTLDYNYETVDVLPVHLHAHLEQSNQKKWEEQ